MIKKTPMPLLWDDPVEKLEVGPNHWLVKEMVLSVADLKNAENKFRSFVSIQDSGCWNWIGGKVGNGGYGGFWFMGDTRRAHRVSWMVYRGPIPKGLFVCHKCDNPPCVNPAHLFVGTNRDNVMDAISKGRIKPRQRIPWIGPPLNCGEKSGSAKLKDAQVLEIRRLRLNGEKLLELSGQFGISRTQVSYICSRKKWKHI